MLTKFAANSLLPSHPRPKSGPTKKDDLLLEAGPMPWSKCVYREGGTGGESPHQ